TVSTALLRWTRERIPDAGSTAPDTAGNGSLMRLAPVSIRYWAEADLRREIAAKQSRTTHGAPEAVDACIYYADRLAEAIDGMAEPEVLRPIASSFAGKIQAIALGDWRGKKRHQVRGTGYVADALEAALWCVRTGATFRETVLLAANLREDADTTAAIAGQLAGALYGARAIPEEWLQKLAWRSRIESTARALFDASL
ncbi:MAG: ADP-ribosylglycohydrolase family protein, partial [Pseudomonadota bacterium]